MALPLSIKANLRRSRKARDGKVTLTPVEAPRAVEREYRKELQSIINITMDAVNRTILPHTVTAIAAKDAMPADGFQDAEFPWEFTAAMTAIGQAFKNLWTFLNGPAADHKAESLARRVVNAVNINQRAKMGKSLEDATGVDLLRIIRSENLQPVIDANVAANVALIKSVPASMLTQIEAAVMKNLTIGKAAAGASLKEEIMRITGQSEAKAKFIARDQTAKINAQITQSRAESLGATSYIWRTSNDERVRPSHQRLNGKEFKFDDPPTTDGGRKCNPGEDYQCRCTAEVQINLEEQLKQYF